MDKIIEQLNKIYPETSIPLRLTQISLVLLEGAKAIGEKSGEIHEKATQLVGARWGGVHMREYFEKSEYAGLPHDEAHLRHVTKLLSDDYQPSRTNSGQLINDAVWFSLALKQFGAADPLPLNLIARALANVGLLFKEMMRALKLNEEINDCLLAANKAVSKHAEKRQPTVEAFFRLNDRANKKPHQILAEIHQKTGVNKTTIRRHLTREKLLIFKGYE